MTKPNLVSEKAWQNTVRKAAEAMGWRVLTTWNSKHSPRGEPDLRMIRPPRVIFAELKSANGHISPDQEEVIYLLRDCPGVEVYVWWETDDWAKIQRILEGQIEWPK